MKELFALIYSYARAAWRRRWWAVISAWMVAIAGFAIVLLLPDHYEASARVFVDARTALQPVLQGIAIEEDYQSQLVLVREAGGKYLWTNHLYSLEAKLQNDPNPISGHPSESLY